MMPEIVVHRRSVDDVERDHDRLRVGGVLDALQGRMKVHAGLMHVRRFQGSGHVEAVLLTLESRHSQMHRWGTPFQEMSDISHSNAPCQPLRALRSLDRSRGEVRLSRHTCQIALKGVADIHALWCVPTVKHGHAAVGAVSRRLNRGLGRGPESLLHLHRESGPNSCIEDVSLLVDVLQSLEIRASSQRFEVARLELAYVGDMGEHRQGDGSPPRPQGTEW